MTAVAPDGRKLLRVEARNAAVPIEKKPTWIKTRAHMGPQYNELKQLVRAEGLHTVCEEAGCPNIFECWEDREATFLIGGATCSRNCSFCQIDSGRPAPLDRDEPRRVAESVASMGLRYATITGVARDDLDDEGAWLYAQTVREIHAGVVGCGVELLTPDFHAKPELLGQVPFRRPDPQRPLRFGYVGTVTEPMPLETLFEAWEKARSTPELAGARLEIFGHLGFFPHTAAALRARLPEEDSGVEYMGGVPKAELATTYSHLDVLVFCVPGARYVTSGKVYEYMAAGKPIVSVHEPEIAAVDVLKGHPLWFGIDSLDPASVADAMARAAAKARSMTQADVDAAREHAARFTRDAVLDPFERRMRRYVDA